jgi:hypothetical protein
VLIPEVAADLGAALIEHAERAQHLSAARCVTG